MKRDNDFDILQHWMLAYLLRHLLSGLRPTSIAGLGEFSTISYKKSSINSPPTQSSFLVAHLILFTEETIVIGMQLLNMSSKLSNRDVGMSRWSLLHGKWLSKSSKRNFGCHAPQIRVMNLSLLPVEVHGSVLYLICQSLYA